MYVCMDEWMYVCVCVCVCVYVCMYVCMYMCVCMYVYMYVCVYVCMYVCMHIYICIYVCMYVLVFMDYYIQSRARTCDLPNKTAKRQKSYSVHQLIQELNTDSNRPEGLICGS